MCKAKKNIEKKSEESSVVGAIDLLNSGINDVYLISDNSSTGFTFIRKTNANKPARNGV